MTATIDTCVTCGGEIDHSPESGGAYTGSVRDDKGVHHLHCWMRRPSSYGMELESAVDVVFRHACAMVAREVRSGGQVQASDSAWFHFANSMMDVFPRLTELGDSSSAVTTEKSWRLSG